MGYSRTNPPGKTVLTEGIVLFKVVAIGMATHTAKNKVRLDSRDTLFDISLQKEQPELLEFIPTHVHIVSTEHPRIGDTYKLTFERALLDEEEG